ncbi:MAG TPA: translation initiation factor IF-3 [bacterium]|nr:translation initiation factor IF-3 [bacterium]HQO35161.1 translation initiation factor IF-3 [bacterium]HQP98978.1 translation initiation factor IF-3 [bacterium]
MDFRRDRFRDSTRVNELIRDKEVRLIDKNGEHLGIVPIAKAMGLSVEAGLDLVEVGAKSVPPVCRIMDYGQYKYEQAKKQREAKKKQRLITLKEIKFRPRIDQHDYEYKIRHARDFLEHGDKVKFVVQFRGREIAHKELGQAVISRVVEDLSEVGQPEAESRQEGRLLTMVMAPLPSSRRKKKAEDEEEKPQTSSEESSPDSQEQVAS